MTRSSTPPESPHATEGLLAAFLEQHEQQAEYLRRHRLAVMRLDLRGARESLEAFVQAVSDHMAVEEELLLPLYEERVGAPERFSAAIYHRDHEKMLVAIERVRASLARLTAEPGERAALDHVDRSHALVHLMEHHDDRERAALFPFLATAVPTAELNALLAAEPRAHVG